MKHLRRVGLEHCRHLVLHRLLAIHQDPSPPSGASCRIRLLVQWGVITHSRGNVSEHPRGDAMPLATEVEQFCPFRPGKDVNMLGLKF